MSELPVDEKDAPEGYYAVKTTHGDCRGCDAIDDDSACLPARCVRFKRADKNTVVFKKLPKCSIVAEKKLYIHSEDGQQMKETQHCNENSFPWHMVDSEWNAVARDGNYPNWYLYKEKPIRDGEEIRWWPEFVSGYTSLSENAQEVIGADMSQWNDVPWEESLMLRPGYQEKEEGNCDDVLNKEEVDHLVNSVKEYPVVKMKELRNYKVGDAVRLKKTGELVVITVWNGLEDCDCCALDGVYGCYGSVDMVLADPPYGTTACKWDSIIPLEPMWEQLYHKEGLLTPYQHYRSIHKLHLVRMKLNL